MLMVMEFAVAHPHSGYSSAEVWIDLEFRNVGCYVMSCFDHQTLLSEILDLGRMFPSILSGGECFTGN